MKQTATKNAEEGFGKNITSEIRTAGDDILATNREIGSWGMAPGWPTILFLILASFGLVTIFH